MDVNPKGSNPATTPTRDASNSHSPAEVTGQTSSFQTVTLAEPDKSLSLKKGALRSHETTTPIPENKPIKGRRARSLSPARLINWIKSKAIQKGWITPKFAQNPIEAKALSKALDGHLNPASAPATKLNLQGLGIRGTETSFLREILGAGRSATSPVVISNVDLSGADLRGLNLNDIRFEGCIFDHARLDGVEAHRSAFSDCSFKHANMEKGEFSQTAFSNCHLEHSHMKGISLTECSFARCHTDKNTDLSYAAMTDSNLEGFPLRGVNVQNSLFYRGKVDTLPLNEHWHGCKLVGVENRHAYAPTGTWGVTNLTFQDMTVKFAGKADTSSPAFIPSARFRKL